MAGNNSDMNIALRITADLKTAQKELQDLSGELKNTGDAATDSNARAARSWKDVAAAQTDAMNRGQRWYQEQQRANQAQEAAAAAAEKHKKEVDKLRAGLDNLLSGIDPTLKGLSKLDDMESKLTQSRNAGLLDDADYSSFLGKITAQRETLGALSDNAGVLALNTKTARLEMIELIGQITRGDFARAGNSMLTLGANTGKLPSLFSGATLAIGGTVAVLVALAATVASIMNDQDAFNRSIAQTGEYAGVTAGQLEVMAKSGGALHSNYGQVRDILNGLVSSGKFTADTIESVSQAASSMAQLTGQSADQVVSEFVKMTDGVSDWATTTNDKYHWLDSATYMRIQALEAQGRTEEAIELASDTFNRVANERLVQLEQNLNWVARAWKNVKDSMGEAIDRAKGGASSALGLDSDAETRAKRILELRTRLANAGNDVEIASRGESYQRLVSADKEELALLEQQEAAINAVADATAEKTKAEVAGRKAFDSMKKTWSQNATEADKEADSLDALKKKYQEMWAVEAFREGTPDDPGLRGRGVTSEDGINFSGGQWDIDVAALNKTAQAAKQYNDQLAQSLALKKAGTQAARIEYEITQGSLKDASAEEQQRARSIAAGLDAWDAQQKAIREAERATKAATAENDRYIKSLETLAKKAVAPKTETYASREADIAGRSLSPAQLSRANAANAAATAGENVEQNKKLQDELNRLMDDAITTKAADVQKWYNELVATLRANGNIQGISLIDQILPLKEAKANLAELQAQIKTYRTRLSTQEQSIQAQVTSGLITEIEGRQRLVELHRQTAGEIEKYFPQLEQIAKMPGALGEAGAAALAQLQLQVAQLKTTTNELTNALRNGLQNGIQSSLEGLATGTMNLSDAVLNLAQSVVRSMAQMASQQLASIAMSGLSSLGSSIGGLFGMGGTAAGAATSAAGAATSAATDSATAASATGLTAALGTASAAAGTASASLGLLAPGVTTTTASLTALTSGFVGATTAATALATAMSAAASSSGASSVAGFAGVAAATGGLITGPGTATSDSIPARLSNGEFVMKAAAVRHVGVGFLHALNNQRVRHFADGGLVSPIPAMPSRVNPMVAETSADDSSRSAANALHLHQSLVVDSGDVIRKGIGSVGGKRAMFSFFNANKETINQVLGVK